MPVIGDGTDAAAGAGAVAVAEEGGDRISPDAPEPEQEPQGSESAEDEGHWLEDDAPIPTRCVCERILGWPLTMQGHTEVAHRFRS